MAKGGVWEEGERKAAVELEGNGVEGERRRGRVVDADQGIA